MAALPKTYITRQEYLARERRAFEKSEYWDGGIYAMAGASREHNLVTMNVGTQLNVQLSDSPCEVYPSDMRVRIPDEDRYVYPDVSVVCDEPEFEDDSVDILINPTVIVEVLSESTEKFDRGKKTDAYRTIPSLEEYVLIAQDEIKVHLYRRQTDHWAFYEGTRLEDTLTLTSIGCTLALADIYRKVPIPTED